MNIYDFADIINEEIEIIRFPNQSGRFMAHFKHADIKDNKSSCILRSASGNDPCPIGALNAYSKEIQKKLIVFNATEENRKEFFVPPLDIIK